MHRLAVALALSLLTFATIPARAQDRAALINEQMDKLVELEINATLPEAMEVIADTTGVPIKADPSVWELLPWGQQTNINATIKNQTLRQALQAITQKLGLTFELQDQAVQLKPLPALRRLGQRATVQELAALDLVQSIRADLETDAITIADLLRIVDQKLAAANPEFAIENRAGDAINMHQTITVPRGATLAQALEAIAEQSRATWHPWGKSIVIDSKEDQIAQQLEKTVNIRYNGVDVLQVLMELSQRAGIDFTIEPGAIQRVPPEFRTVRLILDNVSIRQALESLAGFTGLGYQINDRGVYIWNNTAGSTASRGRVVGMVTLDNGMQVMVFENQLSPELRQYIQHKTEQALDRLRVQMEEEGFVPSTQPAN